MGAHDAAGDGLPPAVTQTSAAGVRRQPRSRTVLIAAASITGLFTVICLIGVAATGDADTRLGFIILGVPFLVAALATTYGARTVGSHGPSGAGEITRAAQGGGGSVPVQAPDSLDFDDLPGGTPSVLEAMRRSYAELDAKLTNDERETEAWRTVTQIVCSIVPTTVHTYRRVAGYHDADAEFSRAVGLLARTFDDRREVLTGAMLDDLHIESRYIQDRFEQSELTTDDVTDGQPRDQR